MTLKPILQKTLSLYLLGDLPNVLCSQIIKVKSLAQGQPEGRCHRQRHIQIRFKARLTPPRGCPQIKPLQAQDCRAPAACPRYLPVTPERRAARAEAGEGRGPHGLRPLSLRMRPTCPRPSRRGGPAPPCRTQHPAASRGSPGECGAAGGGARGWGGTGAGGRWAWMAASELPTKVTSNATVERKDSGMPGWSIYRPRLSRSRLTIGAAHRADRWEP